jgi:hypothetical protein
MWSLPPLLVDKKGHRGRPAGEPARFPPGAAPRTSGLLGLSAMLSAVSAAAHQNAARRPNSPATAPNAAGPTMEPKASEKRTTLNQAVGLSRKTPPLQTKRRAATGK